jgi:hypothetical protein
VWPLDPEPTHSASKTAVVLSGCTCRSLAAADKPLKPPPTMAKSTSDGKARAVERKSIVHGVLPQPALLGECLSPDCNTNPLIDRKVQTDVPRIITRHDLIYVTNVGCVSSARRFARFAERFLQLPRSSKSTKNVTSPHKLSRKKRVTRSISSRRAGASLTP